MAEKEQYIQRANDAAKVPKTISSFSPHTKYYKIINPLYYIVESEILKNTQ
jgi:hypothetical protein